MALFLRARVDASGLTMTAVAEKIKYSRSQVGLYLSGRVPEQAFVAELIRVTVTEPMLRERRQAEAVQLLHAANHPRSARAAGREGGHTLAAELERVRVRQVETYERLTRALEQQADIQEAARNSAQLVMVLLTMINALQERVSSLSAERDQLLNRPNHLQALEDTRQQLGRALDQERRAKEELERAREKQSQAEDLASRVQQHVLELTYELDQLRAAARGGSDDEPQSESDAHMGADPGERTAVDPVGDDIDQALARAAAVNDTDGQTLQRITGELEGLPEQAPPSGPGPVLELSGVVRDSQDNPATSTPVTVEFLATLWKESLRVQETGNYQEAIRLLADLIQGRTQVLGPDHPDTLTARHQHAYNLGEAGDRAGAVRLFAELIADRTRVLGPDHPDTLTTRHQHAYNLGEAGDRAGAVRLFAELIADRTRVLGPDHPHILINRHQHAYNLGQARDRAGAARLYAEIAQDEARVGGPDHPHALLARSQQAYNLGLEGDWAGAARLYAGLIADRTRVLGPDHPDTLTARHQHACNLGKAGNHAEAAKLLEEVLHDQIRVLGPEHPNTIATSQWHNHFAR